MKITRSKFNIRDILAYQQIGSEHCKEKYQLIF